MLAEFMHGDRTAVVLDDEFWRRALRDRAVRERYARRQRELRAALTDVLRARASELGAPQTAAALILFVVLVVVVHWNASAAAQTGPVGRPRLV